MKEEKATEGGGAICWIVVLILVFMLIVALCVKQYRADHRKKMNKKIEQQFDVSGWFDSDEYRKVRRLHKYHGVLSSWKDGNQWYFTTKGGETARLWDPRERSVQAQ